MDIKDNITECILSVEEIVQILKRSDSQFIPPLSKGVNLNDYSHKLSNHARFAVIQDAKNNIIAAIAFYINDEKKFIYIPYVWVDKEFTGNGYAKKLLTYIHTKYSKKQFTECMLEVVKTNIAARNLYLNIGYNYVEDRGEKILLRKTI